MIRKVRAEDAATLAEIYNHYILTTTATFETEPLPAEEMQTRIADISAYGPYFVHESDGTVDGYCYAHRLGERAAYEGSMELSVYLAPQRTGVISDGNTASIALSRKFGFEKVGHLKAAGFKFGRSLDLDYYELLL